MLLVPQEEVCSVPVPKWNWDWEGYRAAKERDRVRRHGAGNFAEVTHPKYGSVIVPHDSNFAAVLTAAEYWGCDWAEIMDAEVKKTEPPVVPGEKE